MYWQKTPRKGMVGDHELHMNCILFLVVFLFFSVFVVCRLWNLVCCFSWNADAHIKSWWWVVASWIFVVGVIQDLLEGVKKVPGEGRR
jgi:hypothetical protein